MKKAIFLDRDGVINENNGFINKKEQIKILPGVLESLKILKEKGYLLIVISNQPVIARGLASEDEIKELNNFVNSQLNNLIDSFYFCPHHPDMHPDVPEHARKYRIKCECRKPLPGMILQSAKDLDIDLNQSWAIGDMITDIISGKSAGCKTILIKSDQNEIKTKTWPPYNENEEPNNHAENLLESINLID